MESGLLSLEDVLLEAEKLQLEVSERTFRYYAVLGLLPRPVKRPPGSGDARVHFYEPSILDRLRQIRSLQAEGHSLKQVKKMLEATTGHSPLLRAVADGRFQGACQLFLQAPATRESVAQFLHQLQSMAGENVTESSPREFEACLRQLTLWHSQQHPQSIGSSRGASRIEQVVEAVGGLGGLSEPAQQIRGRLLELLAHRSGPPDVGELLELRRALLSLRR